MRLRDHRLELLLAAARRRAAGEDGFTMIVAMMTVTVTLLMIGAAFVAANGDLGNAKHDLDGKRAYYAARAGLNNFLSRLNKNTELWQTCPVQTATGVPGSSTQSYSFKPLPANGNAACNTGNPVGTMIDFSTGTFRMQFTGTSGENPETGDPGVSRTIVASFRRDTPLDYLWYSVYETLDPNTYENPADYQVCATFKRNNRPSKCTTIQWITGDRINGPMYTQDQYAICGSPVFGRAGSTDTINTAAPSNGTYPASGGCSNTPVLANPITLNAPYISPPPDNTNLLNYATTYGIVCTGTTTINLSGNTGTLSAPSGGCKNGSTTVTSVNLTTDPIIYVKSGTCSTTYSPYNVTYSTSGGCGNAYVSGSYSSSATIAAANDVIVKGSICTPSCSSSIGGSAVMGLVANNFIRIMHGVSQRCGGYNQPTCPASSGECGGATNVSSQTLPNVRIDAAVLALNHSFIVDNYDCGAAIRGSPDDGLTVNGAIAQLFRGTVGTSGGSSQTGYLKDYTYDDRLAVQQPPYLFDIASANWRVVRETTCVPGSADTSVAC